MDALLEAGREASAGSSVDVVSVCALGPAPLLVDESLEPLTPALLFALDRRGDAARLEVGHDHALPKLNWWQTHEPDTVARAAWALDATGFLVARLTGAAVMDSITRRSWDHPAETSPVPMPDPREPTAIAGGLSDEVARVLGVRSGTPVAVGTYDTFADVLAAGVHEPGQACLLLGSTLVVCVTSAEPLTCPGLETTVYLGEGSLLGGWTASAGTVLDWFARELGEPGDVTALEPGAGGLLALPYLAGERTPIHDPGARGLVLGLTLGTSREELYRALVDGLALSALDHTARLADVGVAPARWRARGGGVHVDAWLQATCDAVGAPLDVVAHAADAVGPALLGLRALGEDVALAVEREVLPDRERSERYALLLNGYRRAYEATAPLVHELAEGRV